MQEISLQTFPNDELWTVQEFLEKNEDACRMAAIELNRKSQMVEEAVEEVLDLVQKSSVIFRNMIGPENDLFGEEEARMHAAEYQNDDPGSSNQQQDWSLLYSCFENPLSLFTSYEGGLPKGMQEMVFNAIHEMRRYYSRKVIDVLIKVTRASLDLLRRRFISELNEPEVSSKPIFLLNAILMIPNIAIRPSLDDLQEALVQTGRNIAGVSKGVAQWNSKEEQQGCTTQINPKGPRQNVLNERANRRKVYRVMSEQRPQMPHMTKSFYTYVMDNKEVVKTLSLISTCTKNLKHEIQEFVKKWKPYHFLWKNDKTIRQLLEYTLSDFEANLRYLTELDAQMAVEPDVEYFGQSSEFIITILMNNIYNHTFTFLISINSCCFVNGTAQIRSQHRGESF